MIIEIATLSSIGTIIGNKLLEKGLDILIDRNISFDDINVRFYDAVQKTANKLSSKYPNELGGAVNYFFKDDALVESLFILLFKDAKHDKRILSKHFDLQTLEPVFVSEFIKCLKQEILADDVLNPIFTNQQIYYSLSSIKFDLNEIAKNSALTYDILEKIKLSIEALSASNFSFRQFINNYFQISYNILSQINYIGLGLSHTIKKRRNNLPDIYVKPVLGSNTLKKIAELSPSEDVNSTIIDYDEFIYSEPFKYTNNIVILGDAGAGKSTLVKSLICDIVTNNITNLEGTELAEFIPFRIELRKYISFKNKEGGNILKYLTHSLEKDYSISNINELVLDDIIRNQKIVIFFDGLDEIFRVEDKILIKDDIESFHTIYDKLFSITTSRHNGYNEAPLSDKFKVLSIKKLNDDQIDEYLKKWYAIEESKEEIRNREISNFNVNKGQLDNELLKNPLLLSLIIILYRNNLQLPESKLDIYQSCTKTLVEKWDATKDLDIQLEKKILNSKEKIFASLAFWQYTEFGNKNSQITFEKARKCVSDTIQNQLQLADDFSAEDKGELFMAYAQKRSIYFENNFTHKTFLEYYTAYWIYTNLERKGKFDDRNELIKKYIDNSFWSIVLELLLNLIDRDQADSEIMDELIQYQIKEVKALPFIISCIPTLKNISNAVIDEIYVKTLTYLLQYKLANDPKPFIPNKSDTLYRECFNELKRCLVKGDNYQSILLDSFNRLYISLDNDKEDVLLLAFELFGSLNVIKTESGKLEKLIKLAEPYIKSNLNLFRFYLPFLGTTISREEKIDLFIENFGINSLNEETYSSYQRMKMGKPLFLSISKYQSEGSMSGFENDIDRLLEKGVKIEIIIYYILYNLHLIYNESSLENLTEELIQLYQVLNKNNLKAIVLAYMFHLMKSYTEYGSPKNINLLKILSDSVPILFKAGKLISNDDLLKLIDKKFSIHIDPHNLK